MLAKILENMWVEPEILEALSEEQKRILFLKMREEQVRRWREREEQEGEDISIRPRKATSKRVSWLLGRDGDVCVRVIEEVDEFRASKVLQNLLINRLPPDNMNGIQTAEMQAGNKAQHLGFKEETRLTFTDDTDPSSPNSQSSEDETDSYSADDDLKDPGDGSDNESGSSSDNLGAPLYRPHFRSHGNKPALKAQLLEAERVSPQARDVLNNQENKSNYGGRVAQLRKAFGCDSTHSLSRPHLPAKPAHLLTRGTSLIH